jgi:hypothetical protein
MFRHSLKVPNSDGIFLRARVLLLRCFLVLSSDRAFALSVTLSLLLLLLLLQRLESGSTNCSVSVVAVRLCSVGQPCCYRVCVGFVLLVIGKYSYMLGRAF